MSVSYYVDRANLYYLQQQHPDWSTPRLAAALSRSVGWVKKWLARLRDELAQGVALPQVLQGHSRTRHHPPKRTEPWVVERVLAVRDAPPEGLRRVPGALAIQYYLPRDPFWHQFQPPVPSRRTIHRILQAHGRIALHRPHRPQPMERPTPLSQWQIDFKDVSSVPAEPEGKRQHSVETLNVIDMGTSLLLDAPLRPDFTAETALQAVAHTLQTVGVPQQITLDRDPRWVGSPHGSDFPSAFLRFTACLGIQMHVCAPHHPQENGFVERYNRTYQQECLTPLRPLTLEQARDVTTAFQQHYNVQRPNQALSCGNQPPRTAFPTLPPLPAVPAMVDPDGWLLKLDGLHLERKVDAHGMVSVDLKHYYVSTQLVGQHVGLHLDATTRCLQVLHEQQPFKSLPLRGLVGHLLSFDDFLAHMLHQARAQARLRSLQERRFRTAPFAAP